MTTTTATRERPINLTRDEALAAQQGTLQEIRRPAKVYAWPGSRTGFVVDLGRDRTIETDERALKYCPFGEPGDVLWGRESFITGFNADDSGYLITEDSEGNELDEQVWYRANESDEFSWVGEEGEFGPVPWKSAATMPRRYSRFAFRVLDRGLERRGDEWQWWAKVRPVEQNNPS